jgi:ribA/ribD-fused uncharacterized protein
MPHELFATDMKARKSNILAFYSDRRGRKFREFSNFFSDMDAFTFVLPGFAWRDSLPRSSQCECSEKAIMLTKASLMGDIDTFHDIESATDPKACKSLGRGVRHFDDALWKAHLEDIAFEVVRQKFEASSELRQLLLATGERVIAEASPNDSIWGIGVNLADDRSLNPALWCGQNILGYALMRARSHLRGEVVLSSARLAADAGHVNFCMWVHLPSTVGDMQRMDSNRTFEETHFTQELQQDPNHDEPLVGASLAEKEERAHAKRDNEWQHEVSPRLHPVTSAQSLAVAWKQHGSNDLVEVLPESCCLVNTVTTSFSHNTSICTELVADELVHPVSFQESSQIGAIMPAASVQAADTKAADVHYVTGDATKAGYGNGNKIIAHIVNDKGRWGKGFVMALSKEFGDGPRRQYFEWHRDRATTDFRLGSVQFVQARNLIAIANMVGQCGLKTGSQGPPVRYEAVAECLQILGQRALDEGASVHMPRIACGLAGGQWEKVGLMVENMSATYGIRVYVYDC